MNHLVRQMMAGGGSIPATVTITSDESDFTDATPFEIQITFDKERGDLVVGDINKTNCTLSNFANSGDDLVYTCDVTPDLAGDIVISIDADVTNEGNTASNVVTVTDNYVAPVNTVWVLAGSTNVTLSNNDKTITQNGGSNGDANVNTVVDANHSAGVFIRMKLDMSSSSAQIGIAWGDSFGLQGSNNRLIYRSSDRKFYLVRVGESNQSLSTGISLTSGDEILFFIKENKAWVGYKTGATETIFGEPSLGTNEFTSDMPNPVDLFLNGQLSGVGHAITITTNESHSGFDSWDDHATLA